MPPILSREQAKSAELWNSYQRILSCIISKFSHRVFNLVSMQRRKTILRLSRFFRWLKKVFFEKEIFLVLCYDIFYYIEGEGKLLTTYVLGHPIVSKISRRSKRAISEICLRNIWNIANFLTFIQGERS